jgi:hypothetical protein
VAMNERTRLLMNRIVSALAGGLLVLAVMSFTVVKNANDRNETLSTALDTSQNEAGRLLADAAAQLDMGDYTEAKASLAALFANQPGSAESVQGRNLLAVVETAERDADARWEEVLPEIRASWTENLAEEMRAEADAAVAEMESTLETAVSAAWDKEKDDIREEWEALQRG